MVVSLVAGIIAGVAAAVIVLTGAATYRATAVVQVDQPAQVLRGGSDTIVKLAGLRLKYAPLVGTDAILNPVATTLGVPIGSLRGRVSAGVPPQSLLIMVDARTANRSDAIRFANAAADELGRYANNEQDELGVPRVERYVLTTIDPARGTHRVSPTRARIIGYAVTVGVLVALIAHGAAFLLTRRRTPV